MGSTSGRVILANCRLLDGAGNPWVAADLLIEGDRIAAIAPAGTMSRRGRPAPQVVDVGGRYATPGFIDPHTHSDFTVLSDPGAESAVYQGVTTHVVGNCGMSAAPVDERQVADLLTMWGIYFEIAPPTWRTFGQYLDEIETAGCAINVAALVGHGTLRLAVMGFDERAAGARELSAMKRLLSAGMAEGAFGLSSGLVYPPGCYSTTEELIELVRVVKAYDGLYTSHVRGERETIVAAVEEAVRIGRECGVPVEVSHNAPKWGGPPAAENLAVIERARAQGADVTLDNDTHTDLAPRLSRALPQPLHSLSVDELVALLADPARRPELRRQIAADDERPGPGYSGLVKHGSFERIVILHAANQSLLGRSVADIAAQRGRDALDTFLDLIVEERDAIVGIFDYIDAAQLEAVVCHPLCMISSDGQVQRLPAPGDDASYSPCSFGEYTGLLERFVRDRALLRLEEAVRKMTSLPAQRFGLWDRGVLRPGAQADVVVFDLDRVRDRATNLYPHSYPFKNVPHRYAEGIDYVFVNGEAVLWEGAHTGVKSGRVLRGPGTRRRGGARPGRNASRGRV
jgi:N-acyl-D-amino-acid deacylase